MFAFKVEYRPNCHAEVFCTEASRLFSKLTLMGFFIKKRFRMTSKCEFKIDFDNTDEDGILKFDG